MSAKAELVFIFLFSMVVPFIAYPMAISFIHNIENGSDPLLSTPVVSIKKYPKSEEPISLLFIGDIMLDRTIRLNGNIYGYENLFACLKEDFASYNDIIGNLEGTVTNFSSVSAGARYEAPESFRFTFDPEALKILVGMGLSVVSIGNNHIRDFGNEGISQTLKNADDLGLITFGDPREGGENYTIKTYENTRIAFIAYNQFFGSEEQTLADLKFLTPSTDLQIIFSHWGDEYVPARHDTKRFAYRLVDEGADLIIGSHPHIIQEKEEYEGTWIYYSLGNFIFDQYWEDAVRIGLAVDVTILNKKIENIKEYKVENKRQEGSCIKNPDTLMPGVVEDLL